MADRAVHTVCTPCTHHVHTMYTPPGLITYYMLPTYLRTKVVALEWLDVYNNRMGGDVPASIADLQVRR